MANHVDFSQRHCMYSNTVCGKANYSLSHKTVNTRENFNQMQDETAEDNGGTTAGISDDLIVNNELALSSMRNLQFLLCISLKKLFFFGLV